MQYLYVGPDLTLDLFGRRCDLKPDSCLLPLWAQIMLNHVEFLLLLNSEVHFPHKWKWTFPDLL